MAGHIPPNTTGNAKIPKPSSLSWIKKIENEEPIAEVKEEYKDVDGIGKMIRIFFLGHFNKMMGINNELSEEYEREMSLHTVSLDEGDD